MTTPLIYSRSSSSIRKVHFLFKEVLDRILDWIQKFPSQDNLNDSVHAHLWATLISTDILVFRYLNCQFFNGLVLHYIHFLDLVQHYLTEAVNQRYYLLESDIINKKQLLWLSIELISLLFSSEDSIDHIISQISSVQFQNHVFKFIVSLIPFFKLFSDKVCLE